MTDERDIGDDAWESLTEEQQRRVAALLSDEAVDAVHRVSTRTKPLLVALQKPSGAPARAEIDYAGLVENFDAFSCPGCGVTDGELHRPGCREGLYSREADYAVARALLEGYGMLRATPARVKPLRLRLVLDAQGPHWLSLLAQCAWLRGGIIGAKVVPQQT